MHLCGGQKSYGGAEGDSPLKHDLRLRSSVCRRLYRNATVVQDWSVQWVNPLDDTAGQSFDGQSSINMVLGSPSFLLPKPFVSTECDHLYVSKWGLSDSGHKVDTVEMCRCRVKMEVT